MSHAISQEQYSIWSWFLVHLCKMMISPVMFFIFLTFWFFGLLGGKKYLKMKSKNYICHVPYLRNSTAYDHDFWHHLGKMMISPGFFFSFFWNFLFWAVRGVKGQKIAQNKKQQLHSPCYGTYRHFFVFFYPTIDPSRTV